MDKLVGNFLMTMLNVAQVSLSHIVKIQCPTNAINKTIELHRGNAPPRVP